MGTYFTPRYEQESIDEGIEFQQQETGFTVPWWFYDPKKSEVDPIYGEGSFAALGRRFRGPFPMPVYQVSRQQGAEQQTAEGFYTVDTISLVLSYRQATNAGLLPEVDRTNQHLKDRFVFDNLVWSPTAISARNLLGGGGTRSTIIVTARQVMPDELVNDRDFQKYAATPDPHETLVFDVDPV